MRNVLVQQTRNANNDFLLSHFISFAFINYENKRNSFAKNLFFTFAWELVFIQFCSREALQSLGFVGLCCNTFKIALSLKSFLCSAQEAKVGNLITLSRYRVRGLCRMRLSFKYCVEAERAVNDMLKTSTWS